MLTLQLPGDVVEWTHATVAASVDYPGLLKGVGSLYPIATGTGCVLPVLGDGIDGIYDRVEYRYNRLGHVIWTKDQNETVHEYAFDGVGRQTSDRVTLLQGSAIDDSVLRIEHEYEVRGMVATYDAGSRRTSRTLGDTPGTSHRSEWQRGGGLLVALAGHRSSCF